MERIINAIQATKKVVPGYLEKTLEQRVQGCGSVFSGITTVEEAEAAIKAAKWEPFSHESLQEGTVAFKSVDLVGRLGIVDLSGLNPEEKVVLDDRKGTGKVSCTVRGQLGPDVDFTVLILGPEKGEEVVYTIHPGAPVRASQVVCLPGMHGREVTVAEAMKMGLETAKVV